jgi:hypothetical protein
LNDEFGGFGPSNYYLFSLSAKKDVLLIQVYLLAKMDTLIPLAKENNPMAKTLTKPCKRTKQLLLSNKSLTMETFPNNVC